MNKKLKFGLDLLEIYKFTNLIKIYQKSIF